MFNRFCFGALLFAGLAIPFTGCNSTSNGLDSIQVAPTSAALTVGGSSVQLTVMGTFGNGSHPTLKSVTTGLTWTSSNAGVATVSDTGVVSPLIAGSTTVTATAQGFAGVVTTSSSITVTAPAGGGGGGTGGDIVTLSITPAAPSVNAPTQTSQFLAIGTNVGGSTFDETANVTWIASNSQVATICTAKGTVTCGGATPGLATAIGKGSTTITAVFLNADTTVATGSTTFTVLSSGLQSITAVNIIPGSQSLSATGQKGQFFALGTDSTGLVTDLSNDPNLRWVSSIPTIATVSTYPTNPAGFAVGVSPGSTAITAFYTNNDAAHSIVASAPVSVGVSIVAAPEPLLSIHIIPGDTTVTNKGQSGQFLAFGTFSTTPTVMDITNGISHPGFAGCVALPCTTVAPVTWLSFAPDVATVDSSGTTGENGGLATALGFEGSSVIYAEATNTDGTTVISDNAPKFSCILSPPTPPICDPNPAIPETFSTLTVFNVGENTTTWRVTAPSDTGVANLIHCGPVFAGTAAGSVCTGTYAVGTQVTLTASPTGTGFGGWSANCGTPITTTTTTTDPVTGVTTTTTTITGFIPDMTPTCTVTLLSDASVGAIFY